MILRSKKTLEASLTIGDMKKRIRLRHRLLRFKTQFGIRRLKISKGTLKNKILWNRVVSIIFLISILTSSIVGFTDVQPVQADVSRTGSVGAIESATNNSSQSVTVPSDAEIAIVAVTGYEADDDYYGTGTVTLGGSSMTLERYETPSQLTAIWYLVDPSTGSQTLAWDWNGTSDSDEGTTIVHAYYKGIDKNNPIRDSGGESTNNAASATTGSMTAISGDYVIAVGGGNGTGATWSGVTEQHDNVYNSNIGTYADVVATGDTTATVTVTTGWAAVSGLVIAQASETPLLTQEGYVFENDDGTKPWYDRSWLYRMKFTVDSSQVVGDLTDFPVYLDLNDFGSDFHDNVQSDGDDIRITKADGVTELAREVVDIDTGAADSGEVHFKADTLYSGNDTSFYIYYGNSGASDYAVTDTYGAQAVWSNGYVSVWHLNKDCADAASDCITDSVGNNHLTSEGFATGGDNDVAGKLGRADDFDGVDSFHDMPDDASQNVGTTYSASAWVNTDTSQQQGVFTSIEYTDIHLRIDSDDDLHLLAYRSNDASWATYDQQSSDTGSRITTGGGWQHYSVAVDGTDGNIYYDGSEVSSYSQTIGSTYTGDTGLPAQVGIGLHRSFGTPDDPFDGQIDEVRFSDETWSDNWIETEFNNQDDPDNFYTVGSEEPISESSALAGSEFSSGKILASVRQGERINLRFQLTNSGGALTNDTNLGLFYDRNDGIWSRVKSGVPAVNTTGDCDTDTNFSCETIGTTGDLGYYIDMAINPVTGLPWVAFRHNNADYSLWVAEYVGEGGNCDTTHAGSDAWACTEVDDSGSTGQYPSIAFDNSGKAWVSYHDSSGGDLEVAEYVGSGGNCDTTRSGSDAWDCTTVDATDTVGIFTALVIDGSGDPWIGYLDDTNDDYEIARYVGSGGNCDSVGGGSDAWDCDTVMATGLYRFSSGITLDGDGDVWVVSYNDSTEVEVAEYVGSGGDCDSTSGGSDAWDCTVVDSTDNVGQSADMTTDPNGDPWVIYTDLTTDDINVAEFVGSGGNCDSVGSGSDAWECTVVDATDDLDGGTSIGFDASGTAWITYRDSTNSSLESARYVGSGGNCDSVGSGSDAWECSRIDNSGAVDSDTTIEFGPDGRIYVAFSDGDQKIATLDTRGGEILAASSEHADSGGILNTSHADMGSATDTTDRDDSDCLAGSTTWNDGVYSTSSVLSGVSISAGDSTQQCSELMWTLDTSQAIPGETYRFVVATEDSFLPSENTWRGPISVATDGYPELTIRGSDDVDYVYAKHQNAIFSDCDTASWGCLRVDDHQIDGGSIGFAPDGTLWIAYHDFNVSYRDLFAARYVGEGNGSGCSESTAFDCFAVATSGQTGSYPDIGFAPDGTVGIAFAWGDGSVGYAEYRGDGLGDCDHVDWDCELVEDDGSLSFGRLAHDYTKSGKPIIIYGDNNGDIYSAVRSEGAGTGCTSPDWTCRSLEVPSNALSSEIDVAVNQESGEIWLAYADTGSADDLVVAKYIGSGGNCTNPAWECTVVDNSAVASVKSIQIKSNGNPVVMYDETLGTGVNIAEYDPGSGSGCTDSDWDCYEIDDDENNENGYLVLDANDNIHIVYGDDSGADLHYIREVGSGGDCDDTSFECVLIASTGDVDDISGIAIDNFGTPWVFYEDEGATDYLGVAKMDLSPINLVFDGSTYNSPGRSATRSNGQYVLSSGLSPYTDPYGSCGGVPDLTGYCGLFHPDGHKDSNTAGINEQPVYTFANKYDSNSTVPAARIAFNTSVSPATQNVILQVYRHGSTDAWETVSTYSTAGCTGSDPCIITSDEPTGTTSEYFRADGSDYWLDYRLYQEESTTSETTLYLDSFSAPQTEQQLRHGRIFRENLTDPLRWQ